jgi:hypothetical protein
LLFANDFRITEAEKLGLGHGLAFLNQKSKVLMVLTENGDLLLTGKIKKGLPVKKGLMEKVEQEQTRGG